MAHIFSRACEHAVQALIYMAKYGKEESTDIARMAEALSLSQHTLGKVLQTLARAGLVVSKKGPDGGFRLGRQAESISLMDVLEVFHEDAIFKRCFIGIPVCSDDAPCPLHQQWGPLRQTLYRICETSSIADLAHGDQPSSYFSAIGPRARHAAATSGHRP